MHVATPESLGDLTGREQTTSTHSLRSAVYPPGFLRNHSTESGRKWGRDLLVTFDALFQATASLSWRTRWQKHRLPRPRPEIACTHRSASLSMHGPNAGERSADLDDVRKCRELDEARDLGVDYVSRSVPSRVGHDFSNSTSRWSPRSNRAWIRCRASGHVSAV